MSGRQLTVGDLFDAIGHLDGDTPLTAGVRVGDEVIPVARLEVNRRHPLITIVAPVRPDDLPPTPEAPAQLRPEDDPRTIDSDLSRICEAMLRGTDMTFQVRFTMDLMNEAGAHGPQARVKALAQYFRDAAEKVEETISFGEEAGEIAESEQSGFTE